MLGRGSMASLVVITAVTAVVATIAVTYALQTILGTKTVGARAAVVSLADNLRICDIRDSLCDLADFAELGELDFGNIAAGATKSVEFIIKNTEEIGEGPIFLDVRIKSGNQVASLDLGSVACGSVSGICPVLSGDAINLGHFEVRRATSPSNIDNNTEDPTRPIAGQAIRALRISFTLDPSLREPKPLTFEVLFDIVDAVE